MSKPIDIETVILKSGGHDSRAAGVCAMEAVAWLAGEKHSDSPACVSPVIATFIRNWDDALPSDEDRNRLLKPLLPRLIGTVASAGIENQCAWMAMDWLARECAPALLALTPALAPHAEALRALRPLTNDETLASANQIILAARSAAGLAAYSAAYSASYSAAGLAAYSAAYSVAYSAAGSAAGLAAYSVAYSAAGSAARSAAGLAAYSAADSASYSAAGSAARAAARSAAGLAAYSAADSALKPTVERLQESAQQLVIRMCELTEWCHD